MSENYLVINGKRTELTEEQLRQLGIEPEKKRKNPFDRVAINKDYHFVDITGNMAEYTESDDCTDSALFDSCNYFNDAAFARQVALHQLLYRKLLKFTYDNGYEDTAEWDGNHVHWVIGYSRETYTFVPDWHRICKLQDVYFSSKEGAEHAIKEAVEPFVREHPEFAW